MKLFLQALMLWRHLMLRRQAQAMRTIVHSLNRDARRAAADMALAEIQAAAKQPLPHLYGTEAPHPYQPWTEVAGVSFARAQSPVMQLKLRAVARWIAVVYHETRNSEHEGLLAVHRDTLSLLGELKGSYAARGRVRDEPVRAAA